MAPDIPNESMPSPKDVVGGFLATGITLANALNDDGFCERVADPTVAVPVLALLGRHAAPSAGPSTGTPTKFRPRVFLSAYLCVGQGLLDQNDAPEAALHQAALQLIAVFEELCREVVERDNLPQDKCAAFSRAWQEWVSRFHQWRQRDNRRLVAQYISSYVQVERTRRAMVLNDASSEVPAFLREIRRHLAMVGGDAAIAELEAELQKLDDPPPRPHEPSQSPEAPVATKAPDVVIPEQFSAQAPTQSLICPSSPQTIPVGSHPSGTMFARATGTNTPPRVVTLSESQADALRAAYAKAKLAYEAVCDFDPGRRDDKADPIRTIAEKAFWDVFREEVSADPPEYARLGALIGEVAQTLQDILPRDATFRQEVETTLDWEVLRRTLSPALLDGFVGYVLGKVMELEAPVHVPETKALMANLRTRLATDFTPDLIVEVFQAVTSKLRQLRDEVDRLRRSMAKAHLRPDAVVLQQRYVASSLALGRLSFAITRRWLAQTIQTHFATLSMAPSRRLDCSSIVREGLLDLLQCSTPATIYTVPETLTMDAANLVHLQNRLQHVTLVASLVSITTLIAGQRKWVLDARDLQDVKGRLDATLTADGTTLSDIVTTLTGFLGECASARDRGSPLTAAAVDLVTGMVAKTADVNDPVFAAFRSKVVSVLRQLCGPSPQDIAPLLSGLALRAVEADVRTLGRQTAALWANNVAVYGPHYFRIVTEEILSHEASGEDRV